MPTATITGALLGLAYAMHADSLLKYRPKGKVGCAASVLVGAWFANRIVEWDHDAQRRKPWINDGASQQNRIAEWDHEAQRRQRWISQQMEAAQNV
ncbi:hypothetical protein C2S51_033268 [Perilla frutescens var. frutescens]|nr:hypothetical protein C2S51_033268 [Perilla frutescens var. frutescens]